MVLPPPCFTVHTITHAAKKSFNFCVICPDNKKCVTNYSFVDQWFHSVVCFILIQCFSYSGHMNKDLATCKQFCRCLLLTLDLFSHLSGLHVVLLL